MSYIYVKILLSSFSNDTYSGFLMMPDEIPLLLEN